MGSTAERFRAAVASLHRAKNAAYGDAWKKRGEVIGVFGNLARKVDRLELASAAGSSPDGETMLETAIDLLIYALKYETYLADLDEEVGAAVFDGSEVPAPYSTGVPAVERLLQRLDLKVLDSRSETVSAAKHRVLTAFQPLESCFQYGACRERSVAERYALAENLAAATVTLIGSVRAEFPELYDRFLHSCEKHAHQ